MAPADKDNAAIIKTDPDPTTAVKEALTLAIKNLDEKFAAQITGINDGIKLAREELKGQLTALSSNIAERFLANKDLVDQLSKANASALAAALLTQKEGAAKDTAGTGDLLRQLQAGVDSANKATNEKIDRLTSRLDTGEGSASIMDPSTKDALNNLKLLVDSLQRDRDQGKGGTVQRTQDFSQIYMVIIAIMAAASVAVAFLKSGPH